MTQQRRRFINWRSLSLRSDGANTVLRLQWQRQGKTHLSPQKQSCFRQATRRAIALLPHLLLQIPSPLLLSSFCRRVSTGFFYLPHNHLGVATKENIGACLLFSIASLPCEFKALNLLETQPGGSSNGLLQYPSRLVVYITAWASTIAAMLGHLLLF